MPPCCPLGCAALGLPVPAQFYFRALNSIAKQPGTNDGAASDNSHAISPKATAIEIQNVSFSWDENRPIFDSVDAKIRLAGVLGVLGPSGGGKSTFGMLLAGLLEPASGSFLINDLTAPKEERLSLSAYLFQFPERQLSCMTVFDEVAFGLRRSVKNHSELVPKVRQWLSTVGLDPGDFSERTPALLSGGEARKVMLASILAMERPVTILDEPTSGLDFKSVHTILETLRHLSQLGRRMIVISHDSDFLFEVADQILIILPGSWLYLADKMELADKIESLESGGVSIPKVLEAARQQRILDRVRKHRIDSLGKLMAWVEQTA